MSTAKTIALHKALGGGSESGGGSGFVVTFTGSGNLTADKTYDEVLEAIENGTFAYAKFGTSAYMLVEISTSYIQFARTSVPEYGEEVDTATIKWYSGNARASFSNTPFIRDVLPLGLQIDDDSSYADPPSGSLSVYSMDSRYDGLSAVFAALTAGGNYGFGNNKLVDAFLLNGDPYNGGRIDRYEPVSANVENAGEENETITIVFQTIGIRNGSVLLKRITISGGPYDGLAGATVTYSETAL